MVRTQPWGKDSYLDAARLEGLRCTKWAAEWAEKDAFRELVDSADESYIRAVAAHLDISRRTIEKGAHLASQYPEGLRSYAHSPRTHAKWLRQDEERAAENAI